MGGYLRQIQLIEETKMVARKLFHEKGEVIKKAVPSLGLLAPLRLQAEVLLVAQSF